MRGKPANLKARKTPPITMPASQFRRWLDEAGISKAWLARKLGKAPHTVGKWADGRLRVPEYAVAYLELMRAIQQVEEKFALLQKTR